MAPSRKLHAAAYGKVKGHPISWERYCIKYFKEMENKNAQALIACLGKIVAAGKNITLLCSSACKDEKHSHRNLLQKLIEENSLK